MSSDETPQQVTVKKTEQEQQEDIIDLRDDSLQGSQLQQTQTNEDGALLQESEDDFDPSEYGGFPIEDWNRYFGAINDKRQARTATLSRYTTYKVRFNIAPATVDYPDFKLKDLTYHPITKKMWEVRRRELAQIEDLNREAQMQATKLAEVQESLRLRIFNRNKPRGMITNREDPAKAVLEEIQANTKFFQEYEAGVGKRLAELQQVSDSKAFTIYFHLGQDVYDQVLNEDIDDILRSCDFKQIHGSANLRLSKPSSSPAHSPGTA